MDDTMQILHRIGVSYVQENIYYRVGEVTTEQGWIMHLTCAHPEYFKMLGSILPILGRFGMTYKILRTKELLLKCNEGLFGSQKIGKAISVFVQDISGIHSFLEELLPLAAGYKGPAVLTDIKLADGVYYRYGAFLPIIKTDSWGKRSRYMKNDKGELVADEYAVEPFMPSWEPNPFQYRMFPDPILPSKAHFLRKFKEVKKIKKGVKGEVTKGVYKRLFLFKTPCVIKQGKKGMFVENDLSDARDKIRWQYRLQKRLSRIANVPVSLGCSIQDDDALYAMKYIPGEMLGKYTFDVIKNRPWFDLSLEEKTRLLDYLLRVAEQILRLHRAGYYHRDITGKNFLVDQKDKIWMIDVELSYNYKRKIPSTPFTIGTAGYISPDQRQMQFPHIADDYFAFGALMINSVTGIEPGILNWDYDKRLGEKLSFLLHQPDLEKIILSCVDLNKHRRPNIKEVITSLKKVKDRLVQATSSEESNERYVPVDPGKFNQVIKSFGSALMAHEGKWFTSIKNDFDQYVYPLQDKDVLPSLHNGIAGPLYTLLKAEELGYDVTRAKGNMRVAWEYLIEYAERNMGTLPPGLHFGSTGLALLFAMGVQNGDIAWENDMFSLVDRLAEKRSASWDLMHGLAGEGLALMQIEGLLPGMTRAIEYLQQAATRLIENQAHDGSWLFTGENKERIKYSGFGIGIAGIVYFLLSYGRACEDERAEAAALKGLAYLERVAVKKEGHIAWQNSDKDNKIGVWWSVGGPGIAMAFLRAFEMYGTRKYAEYAESALRIHPERIVSHQLTQCYGLSGLGEIYLDAHRATGNKTWLDRAKWIEGLLWQMYSSNDKGDIFWLLTNYRFPTPELMLGNAGVLHFLMRCASPVNASLPLLV
ncbi:serine/threonine protein kinase [Dinghuibacter silviterrae]|uniref:Serine/threonine protein kinase n=2 Tax=Dinghuibacter silviterrae TaxID=1539049 RepID=A0A4R8DH96_9BACT|nr:serine/threonine protein kinase [Dinghuibacter silviterrae]